jgi:hypothetical protein
MSELVKITPQQLDGFDTFEDTVEGEEERGGTGLIQGDRIKFDNQAQWVFARDNTKLPPGLELLVWDILRVVQKWPVEPGPPIEERVLGAGEKIPDLNKLNAEAPKEEWRMGPNGQMQGPYQFQFVVYLLHEVTAARFTWCSGTTGAKICLKDLTERARFMRQYHNKRIHAVVSLTDTFMPTRFGGRQRPAFDYKRWVPIGGEQATLPAADKPAPAVIEHIPEPPPTSDNKPVAKPAESQQPDKVQTAKPIAAKPVALKQPTKVQAVAVPTAKQVVNDEIKY